MGSNPAGAVADPAVATAAGVLLTLSSATFLVTLDSSVMNVSIATVATAPIGTALAGAVLIAGLTASFLSGIQDNPAVPTALSSQAAVEPVTGEPTSDPMTGEPTTTEGART